jgi:hypothetical protein
LGENSEGKMLVVHQNEWHPYVNIIFCNCIYHERAGNLKRLKYRNFADERGWG